MSNVIEPENPLTPPTTYNPEPQPWTIGLASATSGIRATLVHDVDNQIGNKFFGELGIGWANDQSKRRYGHAQAYGEMPCIWETWNFHPIHKPRFNCLFFPNQAQRFGEMFALVDGDSNFVNSASRDQEWELTFRTGAKIRLFVLARWVINEPVAQMNNDATRLYVLHLVDGRYAMNSVWNAVDTWPISVSNNFVEFTALATELKGGAASEIPPVGLVHDWYAFTQTGIRGVAYTSNTGKISMNAQSTGYSYSTLRGANSIGGFRSLASLRGGCEFIADRNKIANQTGSAAFESLQIAGADSAPYNCFRFIVGLQRYGVHVGLFAIDMNGRGEVISNANPTRVIPVFISINCNSDTIPTSHSAMVSTSSNWTSVQPRLARLARMYQALQGLSSRATIKGLNILDAAESECRYIDLVDHRQVFSQYEIETVIPYKNDAVPFQVPHLGGYSIGDHGQLMYAVVKYTSSTKWTVVSLCPSVSFNASAYIESNSVTLDAPTSLTAGRSFTMTSGSPHSYDTAWATNEQIKLVRVTASTRVWNTAYVGSGFDPSVWTLQCVFP